MAKKRGSDRSGFPNEARKSGVYYGVNEHFEGKHNDKIRFLFSHSLNAFRLQV